MGMYHTCARTGVDDQNTCSSVSLKIGDFKQYSGGMVLSSQLCSWTCIYATLEVWSELEGKRSCQAWINAKDLWNTVQMVMHSDDELQLSQDFAGEVKNTWAMSWYDQNRAVWRGLKIGDFKTYTDGVHPATHSSSLSCIQANLKVWHQMDTKMFG